MEEKEVIRESIVILKEEIGQISTSFYQRRDSEAYRALNKLIEKMLDFMKKLGTITNKYTEMMNLILTEAVKALQNKDGVLIADLLKYDLDEILNQINVEL